MSDRDMWVENFIKESFAEQKKSRRWGVFFKALTFIYLFVATAIAEQRRLNKYSDRNLRYKSYLDKLK